MRLKKSLTVRALVGDERVELANTIALWSSFAETKCLESSLLLPNLIKDNMTSAKRLDIFRNSFHIYNGIKGILEGPSSVSQKIFICCTNDGGINKVQAVACAIIQNHKASFTDPKDYQYLYIDYLASRPQNLISPLNKD